MRIIFGYGYDSTSHMQVRKLSLPNAAYITNTYLLVLSIDYSIGTKKGPD